MLNFHYLVIFDFQKLLGVAIGIFLVGPISDVQGLGIPNKWIMQSTATFS